MGFFTWLISLFNPDSSRKDAHTGNEEEEEIEELVALGII